MQRNITIRILPEYISDYPAVVQHISRMTGVSEQEITGYHLLKSSLDARGKRVFYQLMLTVFINEPFREMERQHFDFEDVSNSKKSVVVIGGGPAGIFAALKLIEQGIKPVILERGKEVRARRRDLAVLNREGVVNPESNYCFGEGGAGTYSDGKLYTRSSKRGDVRRILGLFVHFGADERILYEAHPHIGTNKLPGIITSMRKRILECGGEFYFEKKVTDLVLEKGTLKVVRTSDGDEITGDSFILATGHSARDIFILLHRKNIQILAKSFALGVRIEHPQELINSIQYGGNGDLGGVLPPASYSLVEQVKGRGVFSFCMCPGGIIAPASTQTGELVVNGWSPSKRNNPYANSGVVVQVEKEDLAAYYSKGKNLENSDLNSPLVMMNFQKEIESKAWQAGGGRMVAPTQRMVDFTENRLSSTLPACSYLPGVRSFPLQELLPGFICERLKTAFRSWGAQLSGRGERHGYFTNEAVLVATESRTSSPVRIPRDEKLFHHPQLANLYPCGEGAGYAGGIVSAAMDGERVAEACILSLSR